MILMAGSTSIARLLQQKRPVVSLEFFPPKDEAGGTQFVRAVENIRRFFRPDFVSITYGAGGSTREPTLRYATLLKNQFGLEVMPHLTCVGSSRHEIASVLAQFQREGFRNLMVLRGDPPQGDQVFAAHLDGFLHASDLLAYISRNFSGFCNGVAGYPEVHPEAVTAEDDLSWLKHKVDQGASFITTQLFFDNCHYFRFVERCRNRNIKVPIIPGLLPVLSVSQIKRFCSLCGAALPRKLEDNLKAAGKSSAAVRRVGIEWARNQIEGLLEGGAPGIHLYILNRSRSAIAILEKLEKAGALQLSH